MSVEAQITRHEVLLARHDERLDTLDNSVDDTKADVADIAAKIDKAGWLLISTLMGVVGILGKLLLFK